MEGLLEKLCRLQCGLKLDSITFGHTAQQDSSYTSHAMSPAAVLHAFRQVHGVDAPPAYLLHMRGYAFELGDALTAQAAENLRAALAWMQHFVREKTEKT